MADRCAPSSRLVLTLLFAVGSLASLSMGCSSASGRTPSAPSHNVSSLGTPAKEAAPKTAKLALRSAIIQETSTTLSCHGGAFCRENLINSGPGTNTEDAIEDATDDCARRKGTLSNTSCSRHSVAASCLVIGDAGPITVFTYEVPDDASEQLENVTTMSDVCDKLDGTLMSFNSWRERDRED